RRAPARDRAAAVDSGRAPPFRVGIGRRDGREIRRAARVRLRRFREDATASVGPRVGELRGGDSLLVLRSGLLPHLVRAVPAHELERRQTLLRRPLRQARYRALEDVAVIFVDGELRPGSYLGLKVFSDAERAVGVDA